MQGVASKTWPPSNMSFLAVSNLQGGNVLVHLGHYGIYNWVDGGNDPKVFGRPQALRDVWVVIIGQTDVEEQNDDDG